MSDHGWQHSFLQGIGMRIEVLAELHPRPYLLLVTIYALLGYVCLLLFPLLTLAGLAGVYHAITAPSGVAWLQLLVWLLVAGSCGLVSYRVLQFRHLLPAGYALDRSQAPALFQLVEDTRAHYGAPAIDRILVTNEYRLDIVDTPLLAVPVWSTRSLVVGLPLLQCLSTGRFQCALARRLGQNSRRRNRLLNWLYSLRVIWPRYRETSPAGVPAFLPLRAIFSVYAPLYTVLSTAAARLDELQADSYAMELFSDEDVLDAVTTDAVFCLFLREKYWPAIRKLREQNAALVTNVHARIATVLHAGLQAGNTDQWIEHAMSAEQRWDDPWPTLLRRIENIGHAQARMTGWMTEPVAAGYIDNCRSKLDAALEDLPPSDVPRMQPWPARLDLLQRSMLSTANSLLRYTKNMLHPDEHAGDMEH